MDLDRHGTELLPQAECLELLRSKGIGRLGLSIGSLPVVHPVNFAADGDRVFFRTGIGSKLSAAVRRAVVCLEVDDIDDTGTAGWSVLVTGRAEELVGAEAEYAAHVLGDASSWAGDQFVAIHIELVSGRRRDALSSGAPTSARPSPALR